MAHHRIEWEWYGEGSVALSVAANTGPNRTGTLTIGGETFTVDQAGVCTYQIDPFSRNFDKDGDTGTVAVAAPTGCGWTATSDDGWLRIYGRSVGWSASTTAKMVKRYGHIGSHVQRAALDALAAPQLNRRARPRPRHPSNFAIVTAGTNLGTVHLERTNLASLSCLRCRRDRVTPAAARRGA